MRGNGTSRAADGRLSRRTLLAASGIALMSSGTDLFGQDAYPSRPIRFIVNYPPGGGADILARFLAKGAEKELGATIVIDNKPGAGGSIGAGALAASPPDGYTISAGPAAAVIHNPMLYKSLPYKMEDFTPIAPLLYVPFVIAVPVQSPVTTFAELVAMIRSKGGQANFGTPTTASRGITAYLLHEIKASAQPVPYKAMPDALRDLESGELDFLVIDLTGALGSVQRKAIRLIAATTDKTIRAFPDLPTFKDVGMTYPRWDAEFIAVGPKGMPQPVVKRLEAAFRKVMSQPETIALIGRSGGEPLDGSSEDLAKLMIEIRNQWSLAIKLANIEPQ